MSKPKKAHGAAGETEDAEALAPPPAEPGPPKRRSLQDVYDAAHGGEKGIRCPHCNCLQFEVARTVAQEGRIMRERRCRNCGRRLATYEYPAGMNGG